MAELTGFAYRPGASLLHRLDPRTKLVALALTGLAGLAAPPAVLAAAGVLIVGVLWRAGVSPRRWIRDLGFFWPLLLFVLAARALTVPGTSLVKIGGITLTSEGLSGGGLVCLRLWLVAVAGIGVSATTSPSHIEAAVGALLGPIPFFPAKKAATMLGLMVRFLPEVMRQIEAVREAQTARCIEKRKNPVTRLSLLAVPVFRRVFARADLLASAMEARCYSTERTGPALAAGPADALAAGAGVLLGLLWLL